MVFHTGKKSVTHSEHSSANSQEAKLIDNKTENSQCSYETARGSSLEYKPEKQGLEKVLGPLESEIMELVWTKGMVSVREIVEELNRRDSRNLAYTTVMTIMSRLTAKQMLSRIKESGAYLYEPAVSQNEFSRRVVGKVIDSLFEEFSEPALAHFVDKINDIDPAKLEMLEKLIVEYKRKKDVK